MSPLWALICPLMTVNLYLFIDKRLWAADTISSQNKAPRPVWTLVDTWSPNVAGHATDGSLIRHCDSHLFPIQPLTSAPRQAHSTPYPQEATQGAKTQREKRIEWPLGRQDRKG